MGKKTNILANLQKKDEHKTEKVSKRLVSQHNFVHNSYVNANTTTEKAFSGAGITEILEILFIVCHLAQLAKVKDEDVLQICSELSEKSFHLDQQVIPFHARSPHF